MKYSTRQKKSTIKNEKYISPRFKMKGVCGYILVVQSDDTSQEWVPINIAHNLALCGGVGLVAGRWLGGK